MWLTLFWLSFALVAYTYAGYPLVLYVRSLLVTRRIARAPHTPLVSVVIAAHNEEQRISTKLENLLRQEYPRSQMEILVVSDDSADQTVQRAAAFQDRGVSVHLVSPRQGKHHAQKVGVDASRGSILVFTDAAPLLAPDAIARLVENFADPDIGCAGGEDRVDPDPGQAVSEGAYIRYDMALRRLESDSGSCVGLSGAFFAVRRELCDPWHMERSSDLYLVMESVRRGLRAVSDPNSLHTYGTTSSQHAEYRRKVRTVTNGLTVFFSALDLLNPLRYGFFSIQLLSHKLCRWLVPFALVLLWIATWKLAGTSGMYAAFGWLQTGLYGLAVLGLAMPAFRRHLLVRWPAFFCLTNGAILAAWFRFVTGRSLPVWTPTARP